MAHQVPLDNKDHNGNTALHLAARTGNSAVCSILLQHGADVTLKVNTAVSHHAGLSLLRVTSQHQSLSKKLVSHHVLCHFIVVVSQQSLLCAP